MTARAPGSFRSHPPKAAAGAHHLHPGAAGCAGGPFCQDPLPRHLHAGGGGVENQPARVQSAGRNRRGPCLLPPPSVFPQTPAHWGCFRGWGQPHRALEGCSHMGEGVWGGQSGDLPPLGCSLASPSSLSSGDWCRPLGHPGLGGYPQHPHALHLALATSQLVS